MKQESAKIVLIAFHPSFKILIQLRNQYLKRTVLQAAFMPQNAYHL